MVVGGERAEAQVLRVGEQEAGAAVPDRRSRSSAPGMGRGAASLSYLPGRGRAKAVILGAAPTLLPLFPPSLRSQSREEARRGTPVGSGNLESRFPRRGADGGGGGPPAGCGLHLQPERSILAQACCGSATLQEFR